LRVLETGTIRRVGDTMDRKIDVRVIAATNRNLKEEFEKGNFREDLYYRLSAFPIYIPPLRERKEDIPLLVQHFIQEYNKELKKNIQTISKELMEMLIQREWQGNIRELKNFIYRMMVLSPSDELLFVEDIPESQEAKDINELDVKDLENKFKTLEQVEKEYIEYVLQYVNGNRALAARCLKMSRTTLLGRMKKLGIT
jgi:transcriptional regulator with PAS, ATPase and Fis domain